MNINHKIKPTIMAYVLGLSMLLMQGIACADDAGMEKCYGVAKAGQNDCDLSNSACDKSVIDGDPNYWINVPKGMCNKLVGGMTMIGGGQGPNPGVTTMPAAPPMSTTVPVLPSTAPTTDPNAAPAMPAAPTMPAAPSASTGVSTTTTTNTSTTGTGMGTGY